MRVINLFIGFIFIIWALILYFQSIIWRSWWVAVPFFTNPNWIWLGSFIVIYFIVAFSAGVFLTLGVKGFLNKTDKFDDSFDL